jgi:hypothetical protein
LHSLLFDPFPDSFSNTSREKVEKNLAGILLSLRGEDQSGPNNKGENTSSDDFLFVQWVTVARPGP